MGRGSGTSTSDWVSKREAREAERFYAALMDGGRRVAQRRVSRSREQVLSRGTNVVIRVPPGEAAGFRVLGRGADGTLVVPAEAETVAQTQRTRTATSVVEGLQALRSQMDLLYEMASGRPALEAKRLLDWGHRRLEQALDDLLEQGPVTEPGVRGQLNALVTPRLPLPEVSYATRFEDDVAEALLPPQRVRLPIPTTSAGASAFWGSVRATNDREQAAGKTAVYVDGGLLYVAMHPLGMRPILRTREELFGTTVAREVAARDLHVAINGNVFDVSAGGMIDVGLGHDPVPASATSPIGQVVLGGRVVAGSSEPNRFYIAFNGAWAPYMVGSALAFRFGMGDPPTGRGGADTALGGLGPIIISGLKYGVGNAYRAGVATGAPSTGPVPAMYQPFLVQRNNNTYAALQARGAAVGKVVVATQIRDAWLLVLVQRDGATSRMSLDTLRDKLVAIGCDNAVFGDGSDSVLLVVGGRTMVAQGDDKEEATTVGLGFKGA